MQYSGRSYGNHPGGSYDPNPGPWRATPSESSRYQEIEARELLNPPEGINNSRLNQLEQVLGDNLVERATGYLLEQTGKIPTNVEVLDLLENEYKKQVDRKTAAQNLLNDRINRMR